MNPFDLGPGDAKEPSRTTSALGRRWTARQPRQQQRAALCTSASDRKISTVAEPGQYPGGGRVGAVLLNSKWITPGSVDTTPYNHYSALRSYEDLLGLDRGGADGHGHLGFAAQEGLQTFGTDVFNRSPGGWWH
jgi:hypothetical protein